ALDTETEKSLKKMWETAEKEKIQPLLKAEYQQLANALKKSEEMQLDQYQNEIKQLITEELIKRYRYKDGLYTYYAQQNAEVKRAINLLEQPKEYNRILGK
ncbi:hypothetical protein RZS08_15735, partial [Arthrospira platensis SPKY1]|nr:hypothetical protein [Arthrospira platensis SPKY1]